MNSPISQPKPTPAARPGQRAAGPLPGQVELPGHLKSSFHDQVSSSLLTMLWTLGGITAMMVGVWLSTRLVWKTPVAIKIELQDVGGGGKGDQLVAGAEDGDFEEPVAGEASEFKEADPAQALSAISSLVNNQIELVNTAARASGLGNGEGTGTGDGRGKGPGGPGTMDGIPAWDRWELRMSPKNAAEYTKQLDFFKIELGVVGGGSNKVDYITNLSNAKPTLRSGDPKDEKRIRFLQRKGELRDMDRQIAQKAGINPNGRIVFQFYSKEMYDSLLTLENIKMAPFSISDVRRTVFGIRPQGQGYEFYVIDQEIRVGAVPRTDTAPK